MANYVFTYYVGDNMSSAQMSPEEGEKGRMAFMNWVKELGPAMINPGTPLGPTKMVSSEGVSDLKSNKLMGYSIVMADSQEAAVAMAKKSPHLMMGPIGVSEEMKM